MLIFPNAMDAVYFCRDSSGMFWGRPLFEPTNSLDNGYVWGDKEWFINWDVECVFETFGGSKDEIEKHKLGTKLFRGRRYAINTQRELPAQFIVTQTIGEFYSSTKVIEIKWLLNACANYPATWVWCAMRRNYVRDEYFQAWNEDSATLDRAASIWPSEGDVIAFYSNSDEAVGILRVEERIATDRYRVTQTALWRNQTDERIIDSFYSFDRCVMQDSVYIGSTRFAVLDAAD